MKITSPPRMCIIALLAISSAAHAEFISGSVNFSSSPGGGVIFQDSSGNLTTNLAAAAGVQSWSSVEVEEGSGSFDSVADGTSVAFSQPWIFNPSTLLSPLWTIGGPENFTFHLTSSSTAFQNESYLAIVGTGTLSGNGFEDTPATWMFSTQGVAIDNKFCWSASIYAEPLTAEITTIRAVPDGGTTIILLGGSLLGLCGLRRKLIAR